MKYYFSNPELKISSIFILMLSILTFISFNLCINRNLSELKEQYVQNNSVIAYKIIKNHPELKEEIIPLITKGVNDKDKKEAEIFMSQYGYYKNLDMDFLPQMYEKAFSFKINLLEITIGIFVLIFLFNYKQYKLIYNKVNKLSCVSKEVLEGNYSMELPEGNEGDFSKLVYNFSNMRSAIKNNIDELKREKTFLVNLLSDISHQLKTPLSALIIYNDVLMNRRLSKEDTEKFLYNSNQQLDRMEWLIKSLLKLAKLDAGAIQFNKENSSLNVTAAKSIESLKIKANEKNIYLNINENKDVIMNHDRNWIEEVFINILKNCIEHTEPYGKVYLNIEENPVCYKVIIEDNGEGIDKDELHHIFKRFYKGKRNKSKESVGIGLSLSKSIIEAHGGYIKVESKLGVGTKFAIVFIK
jgi:signal transduction histidine kinase